MIAKMEYSFDDHRAHFNALLPAFRDERYIHVDGKPIFAIYAPHDIPEVENFIDLWQNMAQENGLKGIHFIGYTVNSSGVSRNGRKLSLYATNEAAEYYRAVLNKGFDAVMSSGMSRAQALEKGKIRMLAYYLLKNTFLPAHNRCDYARTMQNYYVEEDTWENVYPTLMPQWDRTPRAGARTNPLVDSTPEKFKKTIEEAIKLISKKELILNTELRLEILIWMMKTCEEFAFKRDTYHNSCFYFDMYLSLISSKTSNKNDNQNLKDNSYLELIGLSCIVISAKIEEIQLPRLKEYAELLNKKYDSNSIIEMEKKICSELRWKLIVITKNIWLSWYLCQWDLFIDTVDNIKKEMSKLIKEDDILYYKKPNDNSYYNFNIIYIRFINYFFSFI